jgi:hypothetical protein
MAVAAAAAAGCALNDCRLGAAAAAALRSLPGQPAGMPAALEPPLLRSPLQTLALQGPVACCVPSEGAASAAGSAAAGMAWTGRMACRCSRSSGSTSAAAAEITPAGWPCSCICSGLRSCQRLGHSMPP